MDFSPKLSPGWCYPAGRTDINKEEAVLLKSLGGKSRERRLEV